MARFGANAEVLVRNECGKFVNDSLWSSREEPEWAIRREEQLERLVGFRAMKMFVGRSWYSFICWRYDLSAVDEVRRTFEQELYARGGCKHKGDSLVNPVIYFG